MFKAIMLWQQLIDRATKVLQIEFGDRGELPTKPRCYLPILCCFIFFIRFETINYMLTKKWEFSQIFNGESENLVGFIVEGLKKWGHSFTPFIIKVGTIKKLVKLIPCLTTVTQRAFSIHRGFCKTGIRNWQMMYT